MVMACLFAFIRITFNALPLEDAISLAIPGKSSWIYVFRR
jgi:hypothetical protein